MPQNVTLYAVIHLCCAAVCDSPVLLDSIPPSMGLLVPRLSPVGPLGLLSHLPAYYLGHRAHPFSYLSLRPSSRRSLNLFLAVPPADVGRPSMPAIMIPGGFNSLTTQPWHIMTQKLADVLVKAHVQFCLTARESPCGPIERSGVSCAWAH